MTPPLLHRSSRIYLIGFMGCGKSTVGPFLAYAIGYDFADLDDEVESAAATSIAAVFRERGEAGFRLLERETLRALARREKIVVALGGGAPLDEETRGVMTATGVVVYLRSSLDDLFARLRKKSDRPLLLSDQGTVLDEEALRERIQSLLGKREPAYRCADIIVETDGVRLGLTVDTIVKRLSPHLPG